MNSALADPTRIGIMETLGHAELSAQELAELLHTNERLMRYHLKLLKKVGAVSEHHHRHASTYEVENPALAQSCHILYQLWEEKLREEA
jgi:DNA-binding transcriptional ArsR family regulator